MWDFFVNAYIIEISKGSIIVPLLSHYVCILCYLPIEVSFQRAITHLGLVLHITPYE